jgi:ATP-dependent exoDNAse (exonuclease V) alpha subunit
MTLEGTEAEYAQILRAARVGTITDRQIDILNTRLVLSPEIARARAHPGAIWIANTRKNVRKLNRSKTELLLKSGAYGMRILSIHKPCKDMVPYPDAQERQLLYRMYDKDIPAYIDLVVGDRVRCTENQATQIGIYNGATGTVVGFAFKGDRYPENQLFPPESQFHTIEREQPIVFVQMDKYTGKSVARDRPNVVAFGTFTHSKRKFSGKYNRCNLPLELASAITTHKAQSMTAHNGAVLMPSEGHAFQRALEYVQLSRCPTLQLMLLLNPFQKRHFTEFADARREIFKEYDRLRAEFPYPE